MKSLSTSIAALAIGLSTGGAVNAADVYSQGSYKDTPTVYAAPKAYNWSGPYIAIGVGYESDSAWAEYQGQQFTPDFAATGFLGTARVGYDRQFGRVVAGLFGEVNYLALQSAGENIDDVDFEYCGGGRAGIANGAALFYANAGYCYVPVDNIDIDLSGPFAGVGAEMMLGGQFTIGAELRHTWRSDDYSGIEINDDATSGRILLTKKF